MAAMELSRQSLIAAMAAPTEIEFRHVAARKTTAFQEHENSIKQGIF